MYLDLLDPVKLGESVQWFESVPPHPGTLFSC
jgi:hypothetical protein